MPEPIEFYFDFSSPYGYLASTRIDALAEKHGRSVTWRPFLLGVAFKATGQQPLVEQPLRGPYHRRDFARSARLLGVRFQLPEPFPFPSLAACRAFYWLTDRDPALAKALARAVYHAAFGLGRDMRAAEAVAEAAQPLGIDPAALLAAINDPPVKERLRVETEAALARGVFGSPFIIIDGEPFWGHDRLEQVDRWLATGGW
ncbi:MAG TPA: 2-hydroxychromene-2-carboxylate isomerase [Candidatus Acidoferrum sp.]|nr:2-hydroxychromene-2-carboxylate isomerase [Candidatus Acidoferrum sp.]